MNPIPCVDKVTGLSHDYMNEFAGRVMCLKFLPHKKERVHSLGPIKRYSEYFPPSRYPSVLHVLDQPHVRKLDEIVAEMNLKLQERNYDGFLNLYSDVEILVYGKKIY